jgi:hypothetical protein
MWTGSNDQSHLLIQDMLSPRNFAKEDYMGFLILAGCIGAFLGGPVGALIGVVIGTIGLVQHRHSKQAQKTAELLAASDRASSVPDLWQSSKKRRENEESFSIEQECKRIAQIYNIDKSLDKIAKKHRLEQMVKPLEVKPKAIRSKVLQEKVDVELERRRKLTAKTNDSMESVENQLTPVIKRTTSGTIGVKRSTISVLTEKDVEDFSTYDNEPVSKGDNSYYEFLQEMSTSVSYDYDEIIPARKPEESQPASNNTIKKGIKDYVGEINIPYLVHFTNYKNIKTVLTHGIIPKDDLVTLSKSVMTNDMHRWDNCTNAVSLSVSFPNSRMFYKYRQLSLHEKWVVLLINPKVLWEQDCAFCTHNAADSRVTSIPVVMRKGLSALKKLFSEIEDCDTRYKQNLEPFYTTDVQAEVLLFGQVSKKDIIAVTFDDESLEKKFNATHPYIKTHCFTANKGLFGLRDYATTICL